MNPVALNGKSRVIVTTDGNPAWIKAVENNWYEGSRWSPNRSWVWYPLQDAKHDLDRFTRYELAKHARYLWKNSPLIRGIHRRIITLIVGSGFHVVFKSKSNPKWAKRAQAVWKKKSKNVNLGPKLHFSGYTRAMATARFLDGEAFSIKTFSETAYENRIQAVEADRCAGNESGTASEVNNPKQVDGVILNQQAEPVAYKFRGVDAPYSAGDVVHHFTPDRPMQYRGETLWAAAINQARDVDDILALEKQCVKDASSRQDIIQTASGELDPETFRSLRYNVNNYPTVFNLPTDDKTRDDYYRVKFGAQPIVLRSGDSYTPYKPDRPGSAWQGFMDFLSNTICLSTGFPPSVVLPIDVGGTDIRRDLDVCQRVLDPMQYDIACELEPLVLYLMEDELYDGSLKADMPDDWYLAWYFPKKINVDRNQDQQDRQAVKDGLMSVDEYHGQYCQDADVYEETVIDEVKRRKDRIQKAGFDSVLEFVQLLSLDPKLFTVRITDQDNSATDPSAAPVMKPKPSPTPAKLK